LLQSYDRAVSDLRQAVTLAKQRTPIDYDTLAKQAGAISSSPPAIDWSNYDGSRPVFDYDPLAKKWALRKLVTITADAPPAQTKPRDRTKWHSEAKVQEQTFTDVQPITQPAKKLNAPAKVGQDQTKGIRKTQGQYAAADIDGALPLLPAGYTLDVNVEVPANTVNWERIDLGLLPPGAALESGSFGTRLSFPANANEDELISTIQNQLLQPRPRFSLRASLISNLLPSIIGFVLLAAGLFSLGWWVRSVVRAKGAHAQQMG
jgi:hypothetical protein